MRNYIICTLWKDRWDLDCILIKCCGCRACLALSRENVAVTKGFVVLCVECAMAELGSDAIERAGGLAAGRFYPKLEHGVLAAMAYQARN
jgi:hypothetical protein